MGLGRDVGTAPNQPPNQRPHTCTQRDGLIAEAHLSLVLSQLRSEPTVLNIGRYGSAFLLESATGKDPFREVPLLHVGPTQNQLPGLPWRQLVVGEYQGWVDWELR